MAVTHQRRPDISIAMMQTILMETTVTCRGATAAWILSIGDMSRWSDCGVGASGLSHMAVESVA